jgi:16S rRNA (cytidine1402-2'-O)-methyltransferase
MHASLGKRQIMLGRELTKLHQEFIRGSALALSESLSAVKGEITVVVGPMDSHDLLNDQPCADATAQAVAIFGLLTKSGLSRRQALSQAARTFSLPVRVVYAAVEEAKKSGQ